MSFSEFQLEDSDYSSSAVTRLRQQMVASNDGNDGLVPVNTRGAARSDGLVPVNTRGVARADGLHCLEQVVVSC